MDDVAEHDPELAELVAGNTRRYVLLMMDVIDELIPNYREREPTPKDSLDVYINHRYLSIYLFKVNVILKGPGSKIFCFQPFICKSSYDCFSLDIKKLNLRSDKHPLP